ncbi:hypothetical protein OPV22_018711 [Ensete ventricosum]|uniref:Uncharacterized protein n=1 Tax=Ensete ventricosum TaxID=4639 RepID=A0AAV8QW85_ENSVE|nr:hypothetical protein OPV22_018711 [Ensete ventricosum]
MPSAVDIGKVIDSSSKNVASASASTESSDDGEAADYVDAWDAAFVQIGQAVLSLSLSIFSGLIEGGASILVLRYVTLFMLLDFGSLSSARSSNIRVDQDIHPLRPHIGPHFSFSLSF